MVTEATRGRGPSACSRDGRKSPTQVPQMGPNNTIRRALWATGVLDNEKKKLRSENSILGPPLLQKPIQMGRPNAPDPRRITAKLATRLLGPPGHGRLRLWAHEIRVFNGVGLKSPIGICC